MVRDRLKKSSVSIIAILLILILIVLPTGYEDAAIYKGTDRVRAKVISTDESSVINNGLIQSGEQYCKVKILDGKFKNETADAVNMLSGSLEADKIFQKGDVAHVVISYSKDKILSIMMSDHYRLDKEAPIDILEIDNTAVRLEQIENLKRLKEGRNQAEVDKALAAITECVKTGKGNLLELAVEAARVRATLGEISSACEQVVGRYKAIIRTISGVYSSESKNDSDFKRACELAEKFAKKEGRQPRIMVAKMGQDGHDRGAKVVATGYADCGFDVDMGPLFQTPAEAAREAVENDVHVVGVSSLAAGHKTLVPQIIEELKKLGREDIVVIAGGVIPAQDYDFLYKAGVAAIFGPGTPVAKAACQILEILMDEE